MGYAVLLLRATRLRLAPHFTDGTQAAGIDFVNESGGADKQYVVEPQSAGPPSPIFAVTWPDGERRVFRAVPADRNYLIRRGADRPITE